MIDGENCVKMIHSNSDLSISICDFFSFFCLYTLKLCWKWRLGFFYLPYENDVTCIKDKVTHFVISYFCPEVSFLLWILKHVHLLSLGIFPVYIFICLLSNLDVVLILNLTNPHLFYCHEIYIHKSHHLFIFSHLHLFSPVYRDIIDNTAIYE